MAVCLVTFLCPCSPGDLETLGIFSLGHCSEYVTLKVGNKCAQCLKAGAGSLVACCSHEGTGEVLL